uniref:Uncharacterized protein n=1 Tax=Oryza brachyantha TaxID=4533 RepID=J3M6A2_ORYBR
MFFTWRERERGRERKEAEEERLTSQTMEQSWLMPFSPRREQTAASVSEPSPHTAPDARSTAVASSSPAFRSFPTDSERASPCSSDEMCRILAARRAGHPPKRNRSSSSFFFFLLDLSLTSPLPSQRQSLLSLSLSLGWASQRQVESSTSQPPRHGDGQKPWRRPPLLPSSVRFHLGATLRIQETASYPPIPDKAGRADQFQEPTNQSRTHGQEEQEQEEMSRGVVRDGRERYVCPS